MILMPLCVCVCVSVTVQYKAVQMAVGGVQLM